MLCVICFITTKGAYMLKQQEPLITFQATCNEMIALGTAITGYIALLYRTVPPCKERTEVINTLNTFRQRIIDRYSSPGTDETGKLDA